MSTLLEYLLKNEEQFKSKPRLSALYSDFTPLSTLNPDGYIANVDTWTHALSHALLHASSPCTTNTFSLTLNQSLLRELNTDAWGQPLALGTVVREALKERKWIELGEFKSSKESVIRGKWRVPGVAEVVGWAVGLMLGSGDGSGSDGTLRGEKKVVLLENLDIAAREVGNRVEGYTSRTERILSRREFVERFEDVVAATTGRSDIKQEANTATQRQGKKLSDSDLEILLQFLERDKRLLVTDGRTIRFNTPGEKPTVDDKITEADRSIASLKSLIQDLHTQIAVLERKVDHLTRQAKEAVAKGSKASALVSLKSKKLTEATLSKRHATLSQLEEVFHSIEQASDQLTLVQVMEDSTKVLAGLNKQVGGVERVDNVVDQLREQMSEVSEVGDVIAEVGKEGVRVDETELDEEFEEMERVEREKKEGAERRIREDKEKKEAEETRKRLQELEETERRAREAKAREDAEKDREAEKILQKSTEALKRVSLEPNEEGTVER